MVRFIQHSYREIAGGSYALSGCLQAAPEQNTRTQQNTATMLCYRKTYRDLRRLTGGILSTSRYFATVRRATTIPCSANMSAILLSESGFLGSSAPISCLMRARIAVEDASPPASVATWLPKKYFNSNMPCGVSMYF